jgi:DNA-directed RNA polymerase subunit RPC12/RpoP
MIKQINRYFCDVCGREVTRFAEPTMTEKGMVPCVKITEYYCEEVQETLDMCKNCNDRILTQIKLIKKEHRKDVGA